MVKLINSRTHPIQEPEKDNSPDKKSSKVTRPKLKLVISNPDPVEDTSPQETSGAKNENIPSSFAAEVRVKGPYLYEMAIHDPTHHLKCDLILEVEEPLNETEPGTVICHFPTISDKALNEFIEEDETLYGMLMIQFHTQILEQLFLFCANHYASELMIFADDNQADALGVYHDFLTYKDQTLTHKGEKTEMVIPADRETFDAWIDFMDEINMKFQQALWREQKSNLVIKKYLKTYPLIS
ncbi:MAG: hypothetical protein ACOH2E_00725 [Candidatus Paracaedibacter sp.]